MLSTYEKSKIKEGVHRIRQEVPEATEEQMFRMLLFVMAKNGGPLNTEEMNEARQIISDQVKEFNRSLN